MIDIKVIADIINKASQGQKAPCPFCNEGVIAPVGGKSSNMFVCDRCFEKIIIN